MLCSRTVSTAPRKSARAKRDGEERCVPILLTQHHGHNQQSSFHGCPAAGMDPEVWDVHTAVALVGSEVAAPAQGGSVPPNQ